MFMVSENWQPFIDHLTTHVTRGNVPVSRIDDAVCRILTVKYACGLFERPRPARRRWSGDSSFGGAAHREVAREAVRKSLVLLKNEEALLPLNRDQRILVAGKNADNRGHQCGGFTVAWQGTSGNGSIIGGTSIWEGIKAQVPGAVLSAGGLGEEADPALHDVAVVVIGEKPYAEGLGDIRPGEDLIVQAGSQIDGKLKVLEPYGRTLNLSELHPEDLRTIITVASRGVPVVTVMLSGRPMVTNYELEASTAFVAAWLPGSEGQGVADVLLGDHSFTGRLSFSWPRSADQTCDVGDPAYDCLFPRGYGLEA
jgi:beta-glucosidase